MDVIRRRRTLRKNHIFLKSMGITLLCFVMLAAGFFAAQLIHALLW